MAIMREQECLTVLLGSQFHSRPPSARMTPMQHYVDISFDCLPLRSLGRFDPPLDAAEETIQLCDRLRHAAAKHGLFNTYYLHRAACVFHLTNNTAGHGRVRLRGHCPDRRRRPPTRSATSMSACNAKSAIGSPPRPSPGWAKQCHMQCAWNSTATSPPATCNGQSPAWNACGRKPRPGAAFWEWTCD